MFSLCWAQKLDDDFKKEKATGYLSVIVMGLNIVSLHRRKALMCAEWYAHTRPSIDFRG